MSIKSKFFTAIIVLLISIIFVSPVVVESEIADISEHRQLNFIENLVDRGLLALYQDDNFQADRPITRGEFSYALARQLKLLPVNKELFTDLQGYEGQRYINALVEEDIINGYPDDTFRPEQTITKAESITILVKALGIKENEQKINISELNNFPDVPANHWARQYIEIAALLDIVDSSKDNFDPSALTTREEAAEYLKTIENLNSYNGYFSDYYPASRRISVNTMQGQRKILNLNEDIKIGRNNRLVELDEIQRTDQVFVVTDNNDNIKYLQAYGMITQTDLATEVSRMTNGLFQPAEIKELSSGNYDFLGPKLVNSVQEELLDQGFSQEEVQAIMTTDWDRLEELSKVRLSEAIAIQTGLPLDITRSILDGDWQRLRNYGQIELMQRIVQEVLTSDIIS